MNAARSRGFSFSSFLVVDTNGIQMTQSGDRSFSGHGIGAARRRTKSIHARRANRRDELEPGTEQTASRFLCSAPGSGCARDATEECIALLCVRLEAQKRSSWKGEVQNHRIRVTVCIDRSSR
ncbi:hypothetical protein TGAM01_v201322 [Trichoderma gamsii]|uniref:Uncharacterized protein n=1 Tax=Trichoderma gamsii TaxID=398673 RepID=A0A2P5A097_9HYPO|nr:hypothetical protein TGAM01_v201322 [Trichoderma gamsii]PON29956.1 hypothetical protein TGAM01_v201322 [Trichoderma gamsii]